MNKRFAVPGQNFDLSGFLCRWRHLMTAKEEKIVNKLHHMGGGEFPIPYDKETQAGNFRMEDVSPLWCLLKSSSL
jgi:hypothetical protein